MFETVIPEARFHSRRGTERVPPCSEVRCHSRRGTERVPLCSEAVRAEHRPNVHSPLQAMVTSIFERNFLKRDVNQPTNQPTNKQTNKNKHTQTHKQTMHEIVKYKVVDFLERGWGYDVHSKSLLKPILLFHDEKYFPNSNLSLVLSYNII